MGLSAAVCPFAPKDQRPLEKFELKSQLMTMARPYDHFPVYPRSVGTKSGPCSHSENKDRSIMMAQRQEIPLINPILNQQKISNLVAMTLFRTTRLS